MYYVYLYTVHCTVNPVQCYFGSLAKPKVKETKQNDDDDDDDVYLLYL